MKLRSSTKIAIGLVALVGVAYAAYQFYLVRSIQGESFSRVVPGRVNLVGIDPGAGYQIIVANQMAQLVEADEDFESDSGGAEGATSGSIKKRIPVSEMLGVLRGDSTALGEFVMIMNEMRENEDWPTVHVVWTAENLRKAFEGDKALTAKLERDLNVKLDGTPLPSLRPASLQNGIIVEYPVTLEIGSGSERKQVVGRMRQPYKPSLLRSVEERIADKAQTYEMMAGYYAEEAAAMADPTRRENVRQVLESIISERNQQRLAAAPQRVLRSAEVVISEEHIEGASYKSYDGADRKLHDLTIRLTEEGRRRLWKYSMGRVGNHLLLIADGVAIAAPKIGHELTQRELTIKRMSDEVLARDAVQMLNDAAKSR